MNPTNPAGSKSLCLPCDVDWRQVQRLFAVVRQEVQGFGKIRFGNFVGITSSGSWRFDLPLAFSIIFRGGEIQRMGTPEQIATFVERYVTTSPDPIRINEALEELSSQIPEGVL